MDLALDERLHRGQYVAVNVIEEVERSKQRQGENRARSARHTQACHFLLVLEILLLFGRGQSASTVAPMPPRGRNTPCTLAHSGSAARTTSSSTRFTMFS